MAFAVAVTFALLVDAGGGLLFGDFLTLVCIVVGGLGFGLLWVVEMEGLTAEMVADCKQVYLGRTNRVNFCIAVLTLSLIIAGAINVVAGGETARGIRLSILAVLGLSLLASPILLRLHDIGRPGSHGLLLLIPFYNLYILWLLVAQKGQPCENQWGAQSRHDLCRQFASFYRDLCAGRLNRQRYIIIALAIGIPNTIIQIVLTVLGQPAAAYLVAFVVAAVVAPLVVIRRFHDMNLPGWHWWLLLIPLYNIYLGLLLVFKKGTTGPNDFGADPLNKMENTEQRRP